MELWIRSQDRTFLRKVNTVGIVEGRDFWSIDENLTVSFGKFKTKERALEVLDEIQNLLQAKIKYIQEEPVERIVDFGYQITQNVDMKIQEINRIVYVIPKE